MAIEVYSYLETVVAQQDIIDHHHETASSFCVFFISKCVHWKYAFQNSMEFFVGWIIIEDIWY
jgi:hypothetical protein